MDDKRIIELFFDRSEQAIEETKIKYERIIRISVNNIVGNNPDTEEIIDDVYLTVWNKIPPESPINFKYYILKIARNLSLKKLEYNTAQKRNGCMADVFDELDECIPDKSNDVERIIEIRELTDVINEFISSLPDDEKIIFVRRYFYAETNSKTAKAMNISPRHVKYKASEIRKRLKKYLEERGY